MPARGMAPNPLLEARAFGRSCRSVVQRAPLAGVVECVRLLDLDEPGEDDHGLGTRASRTLGNVLARGWVLRERHVDGVNGALVDELGAREPQDGDVHSGSQPSREALKQPPGDRHQVASE